MFDAQVDSHVTFEGTEGASTVGSVDVYGEWYNEAVDDREGENDVKEGGWIAPASSGEWCLIRSRMRTSDLLKKNDVASTVESMGDECEK